VAAGLALGLIVSLQSGRLLGLGRLVREQCLQAELAGTASALRWRLEHDLAVGNHNTPALQAGLEDVLLDIRRLGWAALYTEDGQRLAAAGPALELSPDMLRETAHFPPDELPRTVSGPDRKILGVTRLRLGRRELVLAAGPGQDRVEEMTAADLLGKGTLVIGLAASVLLLTHGLVAGAAGKTHRPV
jgi:hypothetical protein